MREIIYMGISAGEYTVRAVLLLKIFKAWLPFQRPFRESGKYILCIQYIVVQFLLSETGILKRFLYGEDMMMDRSIKSAVIVAACALITFLFSLWLFEGSKRVKLYLVANFYALLELCRFSWYSVCEPLLGQYVSVLSRKVYSGMMTQETFSAYIFAGELIWNLLVSCGSCIFLYLVVKWYCRNLDGFKERYSNAELLFLACPSITGYVFCVFLRGILYNQSSSEIHFLFEDYPETRILVIILTLLLLGMILSGIRTFKELLKRHEEKSRLIIYENQIEEMAQHVKDVENLYAGIRGMRHDMKNHIYAMEVLLKENFQEKNGDIRNEAEKYLTRMNETLDTLEYPVQSGNPITDVVIGRIYRECKKENIRFEHDFHFPKEECFEVFDICVLLNNGLDNGVEACRKLSPEEESRRFIRLRSYEKKNLFFMEIENGFEGKLRRDEEGNFLTTKEDPKVHGIGIQNMKKCVEKYFGRIEFSIDKGCFITKIMLQKPVLKS